MTLTVTVTELGASNSILRGYEISQAGAIAQDVSSPTGGLGPPSLTFPNDVGPMSTLVLTIISLVPSVPAILAQAVSDPINGPWQRVVGVSPAGSTVASEQWYTPQQGHGMPSWWKATAGSSTTPSSGLTQVDTTPGDVVIGDIGWSASSGSIASLTGGFTNDSQVGSSAGGGNLQEQAGNLIVPAAPSTYSYGGTISTGGPSVLPLSATGRLIIPGQAVLTIVGGSSGPPINSQASIVGGTHVYDGGTPTTRIVLPPGTTWNNGNINAPGVSTGTQDGVLIVDDLCVLNNVTVQNCANAFACVYRANDSARATINGGRYTGAGALGIGSGGGTWSIIGTEIDHNGVQAHSGPWGDVTGFEAGGWKGVGNVTVKNCNVHDNAAIGLWWDINGNGFCDNNDINDNEDGGIQFEISAGTSLASPFVISNNRLLGNGFYLPGWFWNPAIGIYASFYVEVKNNIINTVHGAHSGGNGITLVQQNRTDSTPPTHALANVNVHGNTVSGAGTSGAVSDDGEHLATRNLVFAADNVWNAPHNFVGDTSP